VPRRSRRSCPSRVTRQRAAVRHAESPLGVRTVAEILSEAGFQTGATVSHILLGRQLASGLARGFERYDESATSEVVSTRAVTAQAVAQLRQLAASGERFFLFLPFFDPHFDYRDHEDIDFAPARAGRLDGSRGILQLRAMRSTLTRKEIGFLVDRYDEEILLSTCSGRWRRRRSAPSPPRRRTLAALVTRRQVIARANTRRHLRSSAGELGSGGCERIGRTSPVLA